MYGKQTRITRPNLRQPDQYHISLDESMLLWIEEALVDKVMHLYDSIASHHKCDLRVENGCGVRDQWLVSQYGSLDEALRIGYKRTDCTEDLAFLHGELARIMSTLFQARYLRTTVNAHSYYTEEQATQELQRIRAEVRYRETQAEQQTSELSRITTELEQKLGETKAAKPAPAEAAQQEVKEHTLLRQKETEEPAGPAKSEAATRNEQNVATVKQVADKNKPATKKAS